jgi:hypothetical protein
LIPELRSNDQLQLPRALAINARAKKGQALENLHHKGAGAKQRFRQDTDIPINNHIGTVSA